MRARGIEFESEISGGGPAPPLLWAHALMGSMQQEEDSEIMPLSRRADFSIFSPVSSQISRNAHWAGLSPMA